MEVTAMSKLPQEHGYWMADAISMPLKITTKSVTGDGVVKIPMVPTMRLVCPMKVVDSYYKPKMGQSAMCVHVRCDLYLLICFNGNSAGAFATVVDATKVDCKMHEVFKGVRGFNEVMKRVKSGAKRSWTCDPTGGKWRQVNEADSVG
jgi:hypothetical protein